MYDFTGAVRCYIAMCVIGILIGILALWKLIELLNYFVLSHISFH